MSPDPFAALARAMRMDEASWARHANPWSVWTRVPIGPALILALYGRAWIGWWCLAIVAPLLVWAWVNPRAFPPPRRLDSWAARGVLGERILLARRTTPIPPGHAVAARLTAALGLAGLPFAVWGVVALEAWPAILGATLILVGKLWFFDRMVWLRDVTAAAADPGLRGAVEAVGDDDRRAGIAGPGAGR